MAIIAATKNHWLGIVFLMPYMHFELQSILCLAVYRLSLLATNKNIYVIVGMLTKKCEYFDIRVCAV